MQSLEAVYHEHHTKRRGEFFLVNGDARGRFLQEHVGKGKKVLDIGCRDGALTSYYAEGNEVTGIDIDSDALARAKEKLGITTIHADLNGEWPVTPSFTTVVACEIIEHLYYPGTVLKKIHAVLAPGGVLLGTIPHAFSFQCRLRYLFATKKGTPLQDPTHINHFTVRELRTLIEAAGFTNVRIETITATKWALVSWLFPYTFAHSLMFSAEKAA
ncbi:class I SAM-dependent methyltransferase [Patescibacteria group bacterium]|nr:class I SAM-dependent methyltransferase [Patescibacteria group bacterium]